LTLDLESIDSDALPLLVQHLKTLSLHNGFCINIIGDNIFSNAKVVHFSSSIKMLIDQLKPEIAIGVKFKRPFFVSADAEWATFLKERLNNFATILEACNRHLGLNISGLSCGSPKEVYNKAFFETISELKNLSSLTLSTLDLFKLDPEALLEYIEILLKRMISLKKIDISGNHLWRHDAAFLNSLVSMALPYGTHIDFCVLNDGELKKENLANWVTASSFNFVQAILLLHKIQSSSVSEIPVELTEAEVKKLVEYIVINHPNILSRIKPWSRRYSTITEYINSQSIVVQLQDAMKKHVIIDDMPSSEQSVMDINEALENRRNSSFTIYVNIAKKNNDELMRMVTFFEKLNIPERCTIAIMQNVGDSEFVVRLKNFLAMLSKTSIKKLELYSLNFGGCHPNELQEIFSVIENFKSLNYLVLADNNLAQLDELVLLGLLRRLINASNDLHVYLYHNNFFKLKFTTLNNIIRLVEETSTWKRMLCFIFPLDQDGLDLAECCKILDETERKRLAKFCFKSWLNNQDIAADAQAAMLSNSRNFELGFNFQLPEEELFDCIKEVITEEHSNEYANYVLPFIIADSGLSDERKIQLLRLIIKSGSVALYVKNLQFNAELKASFFLECCKQNPEYFEALDLFRFKEDSFVASQILAVWGAYKEDDEAREIELDIIYDEVMQGFYEIGLVRLLEICRGLWGESDFIKIEEELFYRILKLNDKGVMPPLDDTEFLHAYNMASWFTWFCSSIAANQTLLVDYFSDKDRFKELFHIKEVLVEISKLANPGMRYQISSKLLQLVGEGQYSIFIKLSESTSRLLPAVIMSSAISNHLRSTSTQENELEDQLTLGKEVLNLIDGYKKFEGRYLRALLAAMLAVFSDETLDLFSQLKLLQHVLNKSKEHLYLEQPLVVVAPGFCKEHNLKVNNLRMVEFLVSLHKMDKNAQVELDREVACQAKLEKEHREFKGENEAELHRAKEMLEVQRKISGLRKEEIKKMPAEKAVLINKAVDILRSGAGSEVTEAILKCLPKTLITTKDSRSLLRYLEDTVIPAHFMENEFRTMFSGILSVEGLSLLGRLKDVVGQGIDSLSIQKVLMSLFDLTNNQIAYYHETFGQCRDEAALLTYLGKMQTLPEPDKSHLIDLVKKFVQSVLSPNSKLFYQMRYDLASNPHLEAVFKENLELFLKWKSGQQEGLIDFMTRKKIENKEYFPRFSEFLRKKIFDHKHIDPTGFSLLREYLSDRNSQIDKNTVKQNSAKLLEQAKLLCQTETANYHAVLQLELLRLLEEPVDTTVILSKRYKNHLKILQKVKKIIRMHELSMQFSYDIDGLIKGLRTSGKPVKPQDWKDWKIVDTDHYWSLFMAGTDVEGSCQNVSGTPSLNKCLIAYVVDGKDRLLAIVDDQGKTMARCILRILKDTAADCPVLYQEDFYPETIRSDLRDALEHFAIERAAAMGLPLLASESTLDSFDYEGTVASLYSPAPYEYVDANYDVEKDGVFEIDGAQVVYKPVSNGLIPLESTGRELTIAWDSQRLSEQDTNETSIFMSFGRSNRDIHTAGGRASPVLQYMSERRGDL